MLQKRQSPVCDRLGNGRNQIITLTRDYPAGHTIPYHFHDRDQLVYATRGVMTVRVCDSAWVVPTHRAVWIPAAIPHSVTMSGLVAMRTLYFKPKLVKELPRTCCVVNVPRLLEELVLHACAIGGLNARITRHRHLIAVITDQFDAIELVPLQLPNLSDPRAQRVAEIFTSNPSDSRTLAEISRSGGASKRTVERLFQEEVGMTFGKWRQQLRLMHALRLLAEGAKVTHTALEAGYSTPSAFISAFKKALGTTPRLYSQKAR